VIQARGECKQWLWRPRSGRNSAINLICFPYAGARPAAYRDWFEVLAPQFQVWAAQLPGRGTRIAEPSATSTVELAAPIARAIADGVGGLLAFDVAAELTAMGMAPERLFVSATRAPSHLDRTSVHALEKGALLDWLVGLGGVPEEIVADPDLLSLVLPAIRADTRACETYPWHRAMTITVSYKPHLSGLRTRSSRPPTPRTGPAVRVGAMIIRHDWWPLLPGLVRAVPVTGARCGSAPLPADQLGRRSASGQRAQPVRSVPGVRHGSLRCRGRGLHDL
jgi:medium-chain acyl-[acyl-carrier-protein] hydrolase